jgi:hypothetical protein
LLIKGNKGGTFAFAIVIVHYTKESSRIMDDSDSSSSDSDPDHLLQDEDEDEDDQSLTEEEQIDAATAAAATAAAAATERMHLQIISVLEHKKELPWQTRNEIDELIEEFLNKVKTNVHDMLCNNDNYRGLDIDRDTEAEVETAIRLFPEVLTTEKEIVTDDDDAEHSLHYPIQILAFTPTRRGGWRRRRCNPKAVSFIPLLVRLAIEFGLFDEQYRGGLLRLDVYDRNNSLQNLLISDRTEFHNREHHESVDDKYLEVLVELRKMGVFKKEDIQMYGLVGFLCGDGDTYFANKRFRFLIEWDPSSLIQSRAFGLLLLHDAALLPSIQAFQSVFKAGICYYPNKTGICLLFHKCSFGDTPFRDACEKFGYGDVMKVVEDTLMRYSDTPINVVEALIMSAIDESVHLDCVYFLLRREPDVLQKLLSSTQPAVAVAAAAIASSTNEAIDNSRDSEKHKRKR